MAQQLVDALAAMARTISVGTSGDQPDSMASGTAQDWANLRLARTVASYFDF